MSAPGRVTHWLKLNEANRYPRRIVTLDTESRVEQLARAERHTFRLAVAAADLIDAETRAPAKTEWLRTDDPVELWRFVDGWTRANGRTVVFAHNLGYDLRVADALRILPELGWELRAFSLDQYRCWARWRRGTRGLSMVDTLSFYPKSLATIAAALGMRKRPLPAQDAGDAAWLRRCERDVEITRTAVLALLDYLEGGDMGSFRLTGPAQASAAYRHRFMPAKQLLVHDHSPAIEAERRSAYTGRAEVWRHGQAGVELFEWDYRLAYAHLVRRLPVPVRLAGHKYAVERDELPRIRARYAVLCDVEVETDVPCVPTNHEGRILWPVGRFASTLWDNELQLLDLAGADYRVTHAWLYDRAPALRQWADWIIDQLEGDPPAADPLAAIMLKAWSRTLIGRFGLRYPDWQTVAEAPTATLDYRPYWDADAGETRYQLQVGRNVMEQGPPVEGHDAMPAIMAYVMAAGRHQLWATMHAAGLGSVYYVDTDSLLVDARGHARLTERYGGGRGGNLRFKRRLRGVELIAPRIVIAGEQPRIAGLSKQAQRTGKRTWRAPYWESAKTAIGRGRGDQVIVERRSFVIRTTDRRRRHRAGGVTIPYRIDTLGGAEG